MKKSLVLLIMLLFALPLWSDFTKHKTLYYYKKDKLSAPMLANVLMIRYKPGFKIPHQKSIASNASDFKIVSGFLSANQSISQRSNNFSPAKIKAIEAAEEPLLRTFIIEYKQNIHPIDYAQKLARDNFAIEIAEPYYIYSPLAEPNDPYFKNQEVFKTIKAIEAYNISKGSEDMIIAISDNGVDQSHPDLKDNLAENSEEIPEDGIDNDGNGYVDDFKGYNFAYVEDGYSPGVTYIFDGHGTEVAGIAGASTDNGIGIAGVGYNCKIFPLKTAPLNDYRSIKYGYQSIMYAALRGFKVINCSWGSVKPYSQLEQSIIDYAVANDLAIVASGGNVVQGLTRYEDFYPGAYSGVLSVGETDEYDKVTYGNSSLSPGVRIMAQGINNITTKLGNIYDNVGTGTSYSSPVVAGAVGIVRSHFPDLSARQALELVRITADDITNENFTDQPLIPGRLNLYKALNVNPMSKVAVSLDKYEFRNTFNQLTDRFLVNDTVLLKLTFKNHLAATGKLNFKLSVGYSLSDNCQIIDSVQFVSATATGETFILPNFSFKITTPIIQRYVLRVDIESEDGTYKDFAKIPFFFGKEVTTLSNEVLSFSVSDLGTFGFDPSRKNGRGFDSHLLGNHLYRGGLMATANGALAFHSIYGVDFSGNDFSNVKPFISPSNIGKVSASRSLAGSPNDFVRIEITSEFEFPKTNTPVVRNKLTYKNIGNVTINNPAIGYFYDWDIGINASKNYVKLFDAAIPPKYATKQSIAAEVAHSEDNSVFIGSIAYSDVMAHIGQAAAINIDETATGLGQTKQIQALSSGRAMQVEAMTDVAYIIGMNFQSTLQPGEENFCYICTAISNSKESLELLLKQCADSTYSSVAEPNLDELINIYPNPTSDYIYLDLSNIESNLESIEIYNLLGEKQFINSEISSNIVRVDLDNFLTGNYILKLKSGNNFIVKKIVVNK